MTDPRTVLTEILTLGRMDPGLADSVEIGGADPVLPTPFRLGTAGAAALAAVGLAVSALWRLRGGTDQRVSIDCRRGALALRTNRYLDLAGQSAVQEWDPLSGFHRCRDGWVQLHCQFDHFRNGVLNLLDCDADGVAQALTAWSAQEVEDRAADAGLPVFRFRSAEAWRGHPQYAAVATTPLLEITKIGDSPLEALAPAARPLAGIKTLDLTRIIAGPTTGRTLAEHGADVLRITGPHLPSVDALDLDTGHGKANAHVDLRDAAGVETLQGLARDADIFSQGYRPGTLAGRGFGPDDLHRLRPGIIYVTLSAWSHAGPWADRRGFDTLVQCGSGLAHEQGEGQAPKHLPASALDYLSGYLNAFGAMVALARRAEEGGSYLVRTSLARTAMWLDGLGRVAGPEDPRGLPDPGPEDIAELLMTSASGWGTLTHMAPVLGLSETPPRWDRPVTRLGTHPAAWT